MDLNSTKKTIVDKYDLYFQDDVERYRRAYEAYEQFQGMTNQEAEGSGSGIKRTRTYIPRDREEGGTTPTIERLFGNGDTPPKIFRKRTIDEKYMDSRECSGVLIVCIGTGNCPKALHGQFKRKDHKYSTLMLEAVADQRLWIWHAYFGVPGSNNDLNVLYGSPLFDDVLADTASGSSICSERKNIQARILFS
ncbi:zinc finger, CCHC-type containing protein [Tanacetum coccineum]